MAKQTKIKHDSLVFMPDINRFEVIDRSGRAYVKHGCSVDVSIQDDGRTMKIFIS